MMLQLFAYEDNRDDNAFIPFKTAEILQKDIFDEDNRPSQQIVAKAIFLNVFNYLCVTTGTI